MIRSLLPIAAFGLALVAAPAANAAPVTPPATKFQSSLTEPTPLTGSDWTITKASQIQVSVSTNTLTIKLKLNGVSDGTNLVTEPANTLQVDLRYGGILHTISLPFALSGGKTNNADTKYPLAIGSLPGGGVSPDDSIVVQSVRCLQGGGGPGAGFSFCAPGLTAR